ncbi:MAG: hypothetical protein IJH95_03295 [Mogibacterium sp.]|nr:hypothetical protein [Mogibacterium sp.]
MIKETLEYLLIAFISSAVLIVLSKIILQRLIRRPADYYLADELRQEELMLNSAGFSITEEIETNPEGEITEEHIDVTPQISVEEALDMNLIEKERIPERFLEQEDAGHSSDAGSASDKAAEPEKKGGSRKPSMRMRKDELLAIAAQRGIELPEKATKKDILELLNADKPQKSPSGGRRKSQDKRKKQNSKKRSTKTEESSDQE